MRILNIDSIPNIKLFKCGKRLSRWLVKNGAPLLAIDKWGYYCFTDNDLLRKILKQKPFFIF